MVGCEATRNAEKPMPAILYKRAAFETEGSRLVGLQAGNRHFLDALVRDAGFDELACYVPDQQEFDAFRTLIAPVTPAEKTIVPILYGDHAGLSRAGVLHVPNPIMAPLLWQRRYADQRLYSLTGIIHSISSAHVMAAIGDLLIAPFQRWDALVCTSKSGRDAVATILNNWGEYLAARFNARPDINIQLPIIPLGIDCGAFPAGKEAADARARTRAQLGIGDDDVAALFVGRLAFRRKCHPVPMYLALQRAQQATGARLHFIQAGQFEDESEEEAFRAAAAQFCPDVRTVVVGGREVFRDQGVWFAGDIFLSLSDNIQETFGLAPVEAMAVGLPAVVSDWDGYRDTVRDGVDGFRIATTLPSPTAGLDLAARYHEFGNFRHYYGLAAMSSAVDIDACAEALARLVRDPALRHRMGQEGRRRARATYDWPVVMQAYRHLWDGLAETRRTAPMAAPTSAGQAPHPLCDDPFRVFASYATRTIGAGAAVSPDDRSSTGLEELRGCAMTEFGADWRIDQEMADAILDRVRREGTLTLAAIADDAHAPEDRLQRTIGYMLKFGLLRIANGC
jgi:starch synthase